MPKMISPGDDVHTVFRTINREFLFKSPKDHELFLIALRRQARRYKVQHYAWIGMSNHHHLFNQSAYQWHSETSFAKGQLIKRKEFPVEFMVRDTQSYFAKLFNHVNCRDGDLIKDRTKTIKVYGNHHAMVLLIYIFLNPVRAGIVTHPKKYPFSNYYQYAYGKDNFKGLFSLHPAFLALGHHCQDRQEKFRYLIDQSIGDWGIHKWPGASGTHGPGRDSETKAFKEFFEHSYNWLNSVAPSY